MTELEQLRKRVEYLERVRKTAWVQLAEKDEKIVRLLQEIEKARPGDLLAMIHRLPKEA